MSGDAPVRQLGPYRLLRTLGEGGMGTVYLAEQREPIRRRVALKLIRAGMDGKQVVARFEAERQALAKLDHPNIAKVFDAGRTDEDGAGLPYFVMEYVDGAPITEFCDRERLSLEARVELFARVCDAVAHAHARGILHRDLKPQNVLAYLQDGQPSAKVIDFGVAKALHSPLTERTLLTEQGQLIGTPEYMSPEQVDEEGTGIDERADVYSLGVLLYELLSGVLPFDAQQLRRSGVLELLRRLREEEPVLPSRRVTSPGVDGDAVAGARRLPRTALARALRGDLDCIAMMAMQKDRGRRYRSAGEFADDLRRRLRGERVRARDLVPTAGAVAVMAAAATGGAASVAAWTALGWFAGVGAAWMAIATGGLGGALARRAGGRGTAHAARVAAVVAVLGLAGMSANAWASEMAEFRAVRARVLADGGREQFDEQMRAARAFVDLPAGDRGALRRFLDEQYPGMSEQQFREVHEPRLRDMVARPIRFDDWLDREVFATPELERRLAEHGPVSPEMRPLVEIVEGRDFAGALMLALGAIAAAALVLRPGLNGSDRAGLCSTACLVLTSAA